MGRKDKRLLTIPAAWALLALTATWIVSATHLRQVLPPVLFPSSIGISAATFDPTLGLWACNIALIFGALGACQLLSSGLRPDQARVKTRFSYWLRRLAPLTCLVVAILAVFLVADLTPGSGHGRGADTFRALASTAFGLGILAGLQTAVYAALIWIVLQAVRIGYHLHASAA